MGCPDFSHALHRQLLNRVPIPQTVVHVSEWHLASCLGHTDRITSSGIETGNGRLLTEFSLKVAAGGRLVGSVNVGLLDQLMLYREIMAVCSEIHTKHINTVCGQNVELLNVKLAVHILTTGL